jgi:hypothetical protein
VRIPKMHTLESFRRGGLASALVVILVLCQACASVAPGPEPVSAMNYVGYTTVSRVQYLHLLNIDQTSHLRRDLENTLIHDVHALWSLAQQPISAAERERAYGLLRLIAVQNERYPVPSWKGDKQVIEILEAALKENPGHADSLRARNWTRPMWQQ